MKNVKCYVIRIYFRVKLIVVFQKQSKFFLIIVLQLKNYFVLHFVLHQTITKRENVDSQSTKSNCFFLNVDFQRQNISR